MGSGIESWFIPILPRGFPAPSARALASGAMKPKDRAAPVEAAPKPPAPNIPPESAPEATVPSELPCVPGLLPTVLISVGFARVIRHYRAAKWLKYEKNRSTRRSTPRHPIAMVSTAKPPDPMPCALTAILLSESSAPACHMRKTLFPGTFWVHAGCWCVRAVPACGVRRCGVGARRESR